MVTREDFYFEPRIINTNGKIRWYGEEYSNDDIINKANLESTVYIRDNGTELYVYELYYDNAQDLEKGNLICTFKLITKIKKNSDKFIYGRLRK